MTPEREMGKVMQKLQDIEKKIDSMCTEVKLNSEFRIQSKGVLGFIALIFTILGSGIFWFFTKLSS